MLTPIYASEETPMHIDDPVKKLLNHLLLTLCFLPLSSAVGLAQIDEKVELPLTTSSPDARRLPTATGSEWPLSGAKPGRRSEASTQDSQPAGDILVGEDHARRGNEL